MMAVDLSGLMSRGVDTIFRVLKNILVSGNVVRKPRVYNPTTGGFTDSETLYSVSEILLYDYDSRQVDGEVIRRLDKQAILRISDVSVEVTNEMKLRFSGSDEWDLVNIQRDPTNTVYILQIRRP